MKEINISEFKAKCLGLVEWVSKTGQSLYIKKHGKVIAEVRMFVDLRERIPQDILRGSLRILGDLTEPVVTEEDLDLESHTIL